MINFTFLKSPYFGEFKYAKKSNFKKLILYSKTKNVEIIPLKVYLQKFMQNFLANWCNLLPLVKAFQIAITSRNPVGKKAPLWALSERPMFLRNVIKYFFIYLKKRSGGGGPRDTHVSLNRSLILIIFFYLRYYNVLAYDQTRVKIQLDRRDIYINANHVRIPDSGREYILTQG